MQISVDTYPHMLHVWYIHLQDPTRLGHFLEEMQVNLHKSSIHRSDLGISLVKGLMEMKKMASACFEDSLRSQPRHEKFE